MNIKLMVLAFCLLTTLHRAVAMEQDMAEEGLISASSENLRQLIDKLETFGVPEYTLGGMYSGWKSNPEVRDILVKINQEIEQHGISQVDSNRLYSYDGKLYNYRTDSYDNELSVCESIGCFSGLACLACGCVTPVCLTGSTVPACAAVTTGIVGASVVPPAKICCMVTGVATLASTLGISCNHRSISTSKNPELESVLHNVRQHMIYDASTKTPLK